MSAVERPAGVREPLLAEPLLAFVAATALAAGLSLLGGAVPIVRDYLNAFIAVVFFYTPAAAARLARRPFDYRDAGLRLDPVPLNLAVVGVASAVTFPLFFAGFFVFYGHVCGLHGGLLEPMFGRL